MAVNKKFCYIWIVIARSFVFTFIVLFKSFPYLDSLISTTSSWSVKISFRRVSACVISLVTLPSGIDLLSCSLLYKQFVLISKLTFCWFLCWYILLLKLCITYFCWMHVLRAIFFFKPFIITWTMKFTFFLTVAWNSLKIILNQDFFKKSYTLLNCY